MLLSNMTYKNTKIKQNAYVLQKENWTNDKCVTSSDFKNLNYRFLLASWKPTKTNDEGSITTILTFRKQVAVHPPKRLVFWKEMRDVRKNVEWLCERESPGHTYVL